MHPSATKGATYPLSFRCHGLSFLADQYGVSLPQVVEYLFNLKACLLHAVHKVISVIHLRVAVGHSREVEAGHG